MDNKINVGQGILFYAFIYALGRQTYSVGEVVNCLIENWDKLEYNVKLRIQEEIKDAIRKDKAGMNMDIEEWTKILELSNENNKSNSTF